MPSIERFDKASIEDLNKIIDDQKIQLEFARNVKIISNAIGVICSVIAVVIHLDGQEQFIIVAYIAFSAFFLAFFFFKDKENKLLRSILDKNAFLMGQKIEHDEIEYTVANGKRLFANDTFIFFIFENEKKYLIQNVANGNLEVLEPEQARAWLHTKVESDQVDMILNKKENTKEFDKIFGLD